MQWKDHLTSSFHKLHFVTINTRPRTQDRPHSLLPSHLFQVSTVHTHALEDHVACQQHLTYFDRCDTERDAEIGSEVVAKAEFRFLFCFLLSVSILLQHLSSDAKQEEVFDRFEGQSR